MRIIWRTKKVRYFINLRTCMIAARLANWRGVPGSVDLRGKDLESAILSGWAAEGRPVYHLGKKGTEIGTFLEIETPTWRLGR